LTQFENNFNGGTDTTTITTGNSGGASGTAWDLVTIGTNSVVDYHAAVARGALSGRIVMPGATPLATWWQWTTFPTTTTDVHFRTYFRKSANGSGTFFDLMRMLDSGGVRMAQVGITSAGMLTFSNAAGTSVGINGTRAVPNNQWCRLDVRVLPSTTAGEIQWWVYDVDADGAIGAHDQTNQATGLVLGANCAGCRYGPVSTPANVTGLTFIYDDLAMGNEGRIGPAVSEPEWPRRCA
jgi:hypothetical protein